MSITGLNTREESEDSNLRQAIYTDAHDIRMNFADLQSKIRKKIKNHRELVASVLDLKILTKDEIERVKQAPNTTEVFIIIQDCWTFLDYDHFTHIVKSVCGEDEEKLVEAYTEQLKKFCRNIVDDCPKHLLKGDDSSSAKRDKLFVELDLNASDVRVMDFQKFKRHLAKILRCQVNKLLLFSIEEGCVLVTYILLSSIVFATELSLTCDQLDALRAESVISLKYNSSIIFRDVQSEGMTILILQIIV